MRLLLLLGVIIFGFNNAYAATVYLDPNTAELNRGDSVKVAVRLDVDENVQECINAADIVLNYSDSITPIDITTGKSIFPIWAEYPQINKENRTITMAGGLPNGYCGRVKGDPNLTNTIAEIVFRAPSTEESGEELVANITFAEPTTAYLNDGNGTVALLSKLGSNIKISNTFGAQIVDPWLEDIKLDQISPEEFSISIEKDEKTFSGKYYVVFNTTDKQTGLSHYEILEEPIKSSSFFDFGAANAPWQTARSPFVLKDQTLNSIIYVKAIDKAGNEYVAKILPDESMRKFVITDLQYLMLGLSALVIIVLTIVLILLIRKNRAKKEKYVESVGFNNFN